MKKYDYIIYTHSFTDAQLWYGNDEFENTYVIEGGDFKIFFMHDDVKGLDYLSQLTLKIDNSEHKDKIFQQYKENEIEICGTKIDLI